MAKLSRGARNIAWIEKYCRIPDGKFVGQPVRLRPWQKRVVKKIYDNPAGTRQAIISFAKKNAKTALSAMLLLLHVCGPEAAPNSQLYSSALSQKQASRLFDLAAKMIRMSPELNAVLIIRDTNKEIVCRDLGTYYAALSAEHKTVHGVSPIFVVHDELGEVRGPVSELYDALENSMGAHDAPLSIVISSQAANDNDLLSILIDDAKAGYDSRIVLELYVADDDVDPFSLKALKQANPALGDFLSKEETLKKAQDAKRLPSKEALYRNYTLNQRIEVYSPFISKAVWNECAAETIDSFEGLPIYGGLDLSSVQDLTALVLVVPVDGIWHVKPTFWLPEEGLREKARHDRVPYDVWQSQGFLKTTPGKSIEYEYVAHILAELLNGSDVRQIGFDRWGWKYLLPWLQKVGVPSEQLEGDDAVFQQFGQGYASMSPALRDLESALLNQKIAHGNHPVLTWCAANAIVTSDAAGNRKLDKAKAAGRIDGMVALAMAMAMAGTHSVEDEGPSFWEVA